MAKTTSTPMLSKSQFIRGLQCHKSLWLYRNRPELREVSDAQEATFASGTEVGQFAQELFPGGIEIPYGELPLKDQVVRTREAMKTHKVIYEATFEYDGVIVKVDILKKGTRGWELYEVKSSTQLKEVYIHDAAIQYHVLTGAGVRLSKVVLVHIDNSYVRKGVVDPQQLFAFEDLTKSMRTMDEGIIKQLRSQKRMLKKGTMPAIDIGPHCDDPYSCDFKGQCWAHIPEPSVFSLAGKGVDKFALYNEGIVELKDVPLDRLNTSQRHQVEAWRDHRVEIDKKQVQEFLDDLWYPLCFLDFESFQSAIPPFDGTSPYGQIPFQYSLHTLKRRGGKLHHSAFLSEPNTDPRKALLEHLLDEIPEDACILTYNKQFEAGVLKRLAELFPRKRKRIEKLIANVRDLMVPFRGRAAYHWQMQGSYSIKKVLPAFVPDLSYEGLEISDGGMAMEAWHHMCAAQSKEELAAIRKNLLDYCALDTLAMVRLLEVLERAVKGRSS